MMYVSVYHIQIDKLYIYQTIANGREATID